MPAVVFRFTPRTWSGSVRPYRRFVDADDVVHPPVAEVLKTRNGVTRRTLAPSDSTFCYEVTEPDGTVRYVIVPDLTGPLEYADLVEVDPATLDPTAEPTAIWDAVVASLTERVEALEAAGPGGGGGGGTGMAYVQNPAASVWAFAHGLGYRPGGIRIVDEQGNTKVPASIEYPTLSTILITFGYAVAGTAYLS